MRTISSIPKPSDRDAWLEARRPFFNASASAVLFDRHPYLSQGHYTRIKLTGEEQVETEAMVRGRMLEDALAQWWVYRHGAGRVWEPQELFICGRMMATVDRMADGLFDVDEPQLPVEIKTTRLFIGEHPEEHWLDQCQSVMACTGYDAIWLVWMDASQRLFETKVLADPVWQDQLIEGAAWFMSFIDLGMVPEGIQLDVEDVTALHPVAEVAKVELDIDAEAELENFRNYNRQRRELEEGERRAKAAVMQALGDAEVGLWRGEPVVEWKNIRPARRLDLDRLRERLGDELDDFFVESPVRRFRSLRGEELEP